jgi:hypothetical protein
MRTTCRVRRALPLSEGLLAERYGGYAVLETHSVWLPLPPEAAWQAVERYRPGWLERALFALRSLPPALRTLPAAPRRRPVGPRGLPASRRRPHGTRTSTAGGIAAFTQLGFVLLATDPGREVVLGLVGRFWTPRGGLVRLSGPDAFDAFDEPGQAKALLGVRVTADGGGARVTTETRIRLLGGGTSGFRRYWRVIGPFSALMRRAALRAICREAARSG